MAKESDIIGARTFREKESLEDPGCKKRVRIMYRNRRKQKTHFEPKMNDYPETLNNIEQTN